MGWTKPAEGATDRTAWSSGTAIRHPLLRVLRNFGSLAGAEIFSRALALVAVGFYARELQPEAFGYLGFSMAVIVYMGLVVTQGFDQVGAREIAREPQLAPRYVANILATRLLFSGAAYLVLAGLVAALTMPPLLKQVLWIEGLTLLPLAISTTWAFQGLQEMQVIAMARVAQSLLFNGLVLWLVRGPEGVLWVCFTNLLAGCTASVWMLLALRRWCGSFSLALDREFIVGLLRRSMPFALMMACFQIHNQSGLLLLGWWRPAAEVGWFSSAHRLTFGLLQQFGLLLLMAFLPALSRAYAHAPEQWRGFYRSYGRLSCLGAAAILAVFALFPGPVLKLCFGASYAPAAPALRLLSCAIAVAFLNGPYVAALAATRFERELLARTAASASVCLLLNFLLIPAYGIQGAAAALLVSVSLGTLANVHFYQRHLTVLERAAC